MYSMSVRGWGGGAEFCPTVIIIPIVKILYLDLRINISIWATSHLPLPYLNNSQLITS